MTCWRGLFGRELTVRRSSSPHLLVTNQLHFPVSDSLEYTPERSTVVAQYKKIVVGVAIIPSPIETYITYLAVKSGWDKAQIARLVL